MRKIIILFVSSAMIISCGTGLQNIKYQGAADRTPAPGLFVDGMNGVENLAFDGKGFMYATGLDGKIYKIAPAGDPFKGKIISSVKAGRICLGIDVSPAGTIYAGIGGENGERRIARISPDLLNIEYLSGPIPGLNGITIDRTGYLYYTSSNESPICPKGIIYKVKPDKKENFKESVIFVNDTGMVNGLSFSPDESILYYTETTNGVWAFNIRSGIKIRIYSPPGLLQIVDDLTTDEDGTLWFCLNSEMMIVPIKNGKTEKGYSAVSMGAPSACDFGKGPGFRDDLLYVTEFGLKGRSFTMNGRGIWVIPVCDMISE